MTEDLGLFDLEPRSPIGQGDRVRFQTLVGRWVIGFVYDLNEVDGHRLAVVQDSGGMRHLVSTARCERLT